MAGDIQSIEDNKAIENNVIFLACTRPAMFMGVTMESFVVNAIFTGIVFIGGGSFLYMCVGFFIHYIFVIICKHDHNAFRILFAYFNTKASCRTVGYWGCSSITPLPLKKSKTFTEFKTALEQ